LGAGRAVRWQWHLHDGRRREELFACLGDMAEEVRHCHSIFPKRQKEVVAVEEEVVVAAAVEGGDAPYYYSLR